MFKEVLYIIDALCLLFGLLLCLFIYDFLALKLHLNTVIISTNLGAIWGLILSLSFIIILKLVRKGGYEE